ncbi:SigB/SigF/SigG family RNA polymerase sigma factor [Pseudonocardia lacus]|uniref:SigB/SigF/SigG family RNA polymerase sigma factor n=1 Tax=Pseudonocardia lacus TaxID=2835865 RepID=UPI001BDCE666|nr:SigB/SigF/SigG family RNA polymerase sigma factor [Pseudonocardia lacus]
MHPTRTRRTADAAPPGTAFPGLLRIQVEAAEGDRPRLLRASGELDLAGRSRFSDALTAAIAAAADPDDRTGPAELEVDLREVTFTDAGSVRVLARAAELASARGVHLRLLTGVAVREIVALLGDRTDVTAGSGAIELVPTPRPAPPAGRDETPSEYEHLEPLLAEHARLPADDPRRPAVRAALITGYLPVAQHIARRFRRRGENLGDLEQVAAVGLINAVDRFEPERGTGFLAFAVPTITGEVQRHYRDRTSTIRVPRRIRQLQAEVTRAVEELHRPGGAAPRPTDIARRLGIDVAEVLEALEANHRASCSFLDEPFPGEQDGADGSARHAGALSVEEPALGMVDDRESLAPLLDALPERERRIVLLRFFGNQTQSEIAKALGISQMHVSRLLSATLARLRSELTG